MDALLLIVILVGIAWWVRVAANKPKQNNMTAFAIETHTPSPSAYQRINAYTGPSGIHQFLYVFFGIPLLIMLWVSVQEVRNVAARHQSLREKGVIATVTVFDQWTEESSVGEGAETYTTVMQYYVAYILPDADYQPPQIIPPCSAEVGLSINIVSDDLKIIRLGLQAYLDWQRLQALPQMRALQDSSENNRPHTWPTSRLPCVNRTQIDQHTYEEIKQGDKLDVIYNNNDFRNSQLLADYQHTLANGIDTGVIFWVTGIGILFFALVRWLEVRAQRKYDKFRRESVTTKGKVVDISQDPEDGSTTVCYIYLDKFQVHQRVATLRKTLLIGDEIIVLYLPTQPEIAEGAL